MNKNILNAALLSALLIGGSQFMLTAHADGMPYEPVFESVPITESITSTAAAEPKNVTPAVSKMTPVQPAAPSTSAANAENTLEATNLQNALMQLDGAQVEIRNQLIQYKSEYSNIDNQYKSIKEQRKLKAKQVKETEKKIKNLDATKEKIRKNMN